MRRYGAHDGADTWLRIIVAIGALGEPPTKARHSEDNVAIVIAAGGRA